MKFIEEKHLKMCAQIYNWYAMSKEVVFKPLSEGDFKDLFCSDRYKCLGVVIERHKKCDSVENVYKGCDSVENVYKGCDSEENGHKECDSVENGYKGCDSEGNGCKKCDSEESEVVAFGFGTVTESSGYISYIGVKPEERRKGLGKRILEELESEIRRETPEIQKIDCMFYNPCQLSWLIPNHDPHDHPGVPGVHMASDAYEFFKALGYMDYAIQNTYYMPLGNYTESEAVKERKAKLKSQGIEVCFFDKEKHTGFLELFDNIKNEGWRKSVMSRLDEKIVVAVKEGVVIGYTGPLSISKEKRGLFCGIGVHTDYRSHGIGKALFSDLCAGLQDMGAEFMSLFTGNNNPARFVYESVGFEKVGEFSCMRKMI